MLNGFFSLKNTGYILSDLMEYGWEMANYWHTDVINGCGDALTIIGLVFIMKSKKFNLLKITYGLKVL